jgi:hypothetical protein
MEQPGIVQKHNMVTSQLMAANRSPEGWPRPKNSISKYRSYNQIQFFYVFFTVLINSNRHTFGHFNCLF